MVKIEYVLFALFLLCMQASSISMPVLTHTNGFCSDSDGFDPFTKGNVSLLYANMGVFNQDACVDRITVNEWYCPSQEGTAKEEKYMCPFGYVCRDGACGTVKVPPFYAPEPETCLDSDGLDENTSGYVAVYRSGTELYSLNDTCVGWFNVSEVYCEGSEGKYKLIECASDSYCMDGACVNSTGIQPVQVFDAPALPPVVRVSRTIPFIASAGSHLQVKLVVETDTSRLPCAYGISEKIPRGWEITSVSSQGNVGRYPGNGTVRMSEVVNALNAWCGGNATYLEAYSLMKQWSESGIAPGSVEWIILDSSKKASTPIISYTVSIPYNASVNSEIYGDSTWDGVKYRRTDGYYRMIVQQTVTTTTTTTTTLPVSRISGIVISSDNGSPVPGSSVSILCAGNTKVRAETFADEYGYYTTEMLCPYGSEVSVHASSPSGELCAEPDDCVFYEEAKGSGSGTVLSPGYARIDVLIEESA